MQSGLSRLSLLALAILLLFSMCKTEETAPELEESQEVLPYHEQHRPQFHFSPPAKWMNDPNGMVYYAGEYHLFYQYYPDSTIWGPMHWGHAVSKDMVSWENLPIALYPDSLGYIFSGSAVVDANNTSGFKTGDESPLIAIFTYHDPAGERTGSQTFQTQGIAYSNDRGRSWIKYEGNPVVENPGIRDFRDPKVFWHESSQKWVMIFAARDRVRLYNSSNLKDWTFNSEFGAEWGAHLGVWECPDLFELTVDGTEEKRWVMLVSINPGGPNGGSATQYFVGDFDGKTFTLDRGFAAELAQMGRKESHWLDYGRDNYAGVTWSDVPEEDGRRLFMGWMSNWDYANEVPTEAWRSAMTTARSLSLAQVDGRYFVRSRPVKELEKLRGKKVIISPAPIKRELDLTQELNFSPATSELILEVNLPVGQYPDFGVELYNDQGETYRLGYSSGNDLYFSDRTRSGKKSFAVKYASAIHRAPRLRNSQTVRLHIFFDRASAELFADDGLTAMTDIFFPSEDFKGIRLFSANGEAELTSAEVYELTSIW